VTTRSRKTLTSLFAVCLLVAVPMGSLAEDDDEPAFMQYLFAPELILANARTVGLSKEQRHEIMKELKATQMATSDAQWSMFEAAEALNDLASEDVIDEDAMVEAARPVFEAESRIKTAHLVLLIRLRNALTPEQRAELAKIRDSDRD